jgi:hypothetical protein
MTLLGTLAGGAIPFVVPRVAQAAAAPVAQGVPSGFATSPRSSAPTTTAPTTPPTTTPPTTTPPTTTPPAPVGTPASSTGPEGVGQQALAMLSYPYQRFGYAISYLPPKPGYLGETFLGSHQIHVYVRPDESVREVAFVTAFELGHAVDVTTMNPARRASWAGIRGWSASTAWFPPCDCTEDSYGSGDFSDVFASWLVPGGWGQWRSNLGPPPTAAQLGQLLPYLEGQ